MSAGCMIGWFDENGYSGNNGLKDMEELLKVTFSAVRIYHTPDQWGTVKAEVDTVLEDGRLPVVSHKLPKTGNAWVAFHSKDDYDTGLASIVERYSTMSPSEVVVIFHHEPRGNSSLGGQAPSLGSAEDFRKAFRKFADAFDDLPHVKIGYCEIDSHASKYPNDVLYPGSDYIDVLCHDVYNWGGYTGFSDWKDPETLFAPFVADAKAANKPLIFGEIGSRPNVGDKDRGQWLRDLAAYLKTGDAANYVLGFCYYHKDAHQGSEHYWRFAQGSQAGTDKDDFIAAFSGDPHFVTAPLPVSLQARTVPSTQFGENHPSGGTPSNVIGKKWGAKVNDEGLSTTENSGLASSPRGGAWAIRDSGASASLYWLTQESRAKLKYRAIPITGATNADWEDVIRVVEGGVAYLYVHDNRDGNGTGANPKRLYKVAEPAVPGTATSVSIISTRFWKFPTTASSTTCGSKQNCEAIFVFKGVLYAVQKTDADEAEVYSLGDPNTLSTTNDFAAATEGVKVGTIGIHCPSCFAIHPDGKTVLVCQHGQVKVYRGKGDTIQSLLTGKNTLIYKGEPTGSFEGGDWFPYDSSDFLLVAEGNHVADYDVTEGIATETVPEKLPAALSIGGGIPSRIRFGKPTLTVEAGATTIYGAGAIPSPDAFTTEEELGLDFGKPTVTSLGWIGNVGGIAVTHPFGAPVITRGVSAGFVFSPPVRDLQPWVSSVAAPRANRLFRYYDGTPEPNNVYILIDGSVTESQPADPDVIRATFHGGHVHRVDDTTHDILASAGYGPWLAPVT